MTLNRRSFLKLLGVCGVAAGAGAVIAKREMIESVFSDGEYRVAASRPALGTHVDITALGNSKYETEDAVNAAFVEVAALEKLLTRYDNMSPVCELNSEGQLRHVPEELSELYQACAYYNRETRGAFDITVAPLIDLFKDRAAAQKMPTESEIAQIVSCIGAEKLAFDGEKIVVPESMKLTFDGCAPGFIADRAAAVLSARGIDNYLVNAGGEIRTSGHPKNAQMWRIAIQDPAKQGNYPGFVSFNRGAVSTSGNYEIYYGEDRVFHHIVDARTGMSPNALTSVTVTAPTALEADILSTALFVMSPEEALNYVSRHPGISCLLIDKTGKRLASPNFVMS